MHLVGVFVVTNSYEERLLDYFRRRTTWMPQNTRTQLLQCILRPLILFALCGLALCCLNMSTPTIYDTHDGCHDPLLRTTIANNLVHEHVYYQYLWGPLSCLTMAATMWLLAEMKSTCNPRHAKSVQKCLLLFAMGTAPQSNAIYHWKSNIPKRRQKGWRYVVFWAFLLSSQVLAALPAFGFVSMPHATLRS